MKLFVKDQDEWKKVTRFEVKDENVHHIEGTLILDNYPETLRVIITDDTVTEVNE